MTRPSITARRLAELQASLTPLDRTILRDVDTARLVTARQLQRLHHVEGLAAVRRFRRGLARMTESGLLARLDRSIGGRDGGGSAGYIYRVDVAGQRLLDVSASNERHRRPWTPRPIFLKHALLVAELYVLLR